MVWSFKKSDTLPKQQFQLWGELLEKRAGVQLTDSQHVLLQTQVAIRMRELGIEKYQQYFNLVRDEERGAAEWQVLVDRLVVKETQFYRNRRSLDVVRDYLQKHLQNQQQDLSPNPAANGFEVWSVGCSTGEEAYSLATVAADCFDAAGLNSYYGVTAIDISLPALSIARRGLYHKRSLKLVSDRELHRYFEKHSDDEYRVVDKIKNRVCFSQMNILQLRFKPVQLMDVIFCQNVLIYFRRWRRKEILKQLQQHLKPGGLLIIGLGELPGWEHPQLQSMRLSDVQAYVKKVDVKGLAGEALKP